MSGYPGYSYNSPSYPTYPASLQGYPTDKYSDRYRGGERYESRDERYETRSVDRLDRRERDDYKRDGYTRDRAYGRDKTPPPYHNGRSGGLPPTPGQPYAITSQPTKTGGGGFQPSFGSGKRDWSTGLFDCTQDMNSCACVFCCTPFYQCYKMGEFGENCCAAWPCCMGPVGSMVMVRYKMRAMENIEGSMIDDCMMSTFCYACMACQVIRENDIIKRDQFKQDRSLAARMESRAAAEAYSNQGFSNRY